MESSGVRARELMVSWWRWGFDRRGQRVDRSIFWRPPENRWPRMRWAEEWVSRAELIPEGKISLDTPIGLLELVRVFSMSSALR